VKADSRFDRAFELMLPREVRELAPRMREVATLVYLSGGATAKEVEQRLPGHSKGARTLLSRLAKTGVLRCRPSGHRREAVYLPAATNQAVRALALQALVDGAFDGSIEEALQTTLQILSREH
jgi:predicted transcriptional regulator